MTDNGLQAQVVRLKQDTASAKTCSSSTVEELTLLLDLSKTLAISKQDRPRNAVEQKKALVQHRPGIKATAGRSKRQPQISGLEIREDENGVLPLLERVRLATEVVNATLKALSEAVKSPVPKKSYRKSKALSRSSSGSQSPCKPRDPPTPLQNRSVNLVSKLPGEGSCSRRSSVASTTEKTSGIFWLAECSRVAFAALRRYEAQDVGKPKLSHLQLETGMSALIGKLISLGLEELAIKELRILIRRLATSNLNGKSTSQSKIALQKPSSEAIPLAVPFPDLLRFDIIPAEPQTLALVITSQLQVLRIMASKKRGTHIEAAWDYVQLSAEFSPGNLINILSTLSPAESQDKIARQYDLFSQCLTSLCQSSVQTQDEIATDSRKYVDPEILLRYRVLSLNMRWRSWTLSGHQGNIERELLGPFVKYTRVFVRHSTMPVARTFECVKAAVGSFSDLVQMDLGNIPSEGLTQDSTLIELYDLLADLAVKSTQLNEGLNWMRRSLSALTDHKASTAKICSKLCQLAKIELQNSSSQGSLKEPCLQTLQHTLVTLQGSLRGDSFELDDLIISLAGLRKAIIQFLYNRPADNKPAEASTSSTLEITCINIVLFASNFLPHYLGQELKSTATDKSDSRYDQRLRLVHQLALPTCEGVGYLARLAITSEQEVWKTIDVGLQNCARLAEKLEAHHNVHSNVQVASRSAQSPFVLLSNAYWTHYLKQKAKTRYSPDLQTILQKAVGLLTSRSLLEQDSGFLPIKLERLAGIYESSGDMESAGGTYIEALRIQTGLLSLRDIVDAAATNGLPLLTGSEGGLAILGRLFTAHLRVTRTLNVNKSEVQLVFDVASLSADERGFLLEQQLKILQNQLTAHGIPCNTTSVVRGLSTRLLELYTVDNFPIRRLRVLLSLLRILSMHGSSFDIGFAGIIYSEAKETTPSLFGHDGGLERYLPHLLARRNAYLSILQDRPNTESLDSAIETWSDILSQCHDLATLRAQVDETEDWLYQLEFVADHLHMQGYDYQRACVLNLIIRVHELQSTICLGSNVSKITALGLQLTKLGYSGKAGITFQKARQIIDTNSSSNSILLQWHLGYVEYLLEIGNLAKSEEYMTRTKELFQRVIKPTNPESLNERYNRTWIEAEMAHLLSAYCLATSMPSHALFYARLSAKLTYRAWTILERRCKSSKATFSTGGSESEIDTMTDGISSVSISQFQAACVSSVKHESLKGAAFWPLVPRLFHRLLQLSKLFSHEGLLSETQYFAEQAKKAAVAVQATGLEAQINAWICECEIRSRSFDNVSSLLTQANDYLSTARTNHLHVKLQILGARLSSLQNDPTKENEYLGNALENFTRLLNTEFLTLASSKQNQHESLDISISRLALVEKDVKSKQTQPKPLRTTKRKPVTISALEVTKVASIDYQNTDVLPLLQLRAEILELQADRAIRSGDLTLAFSFAAEAAGVPVVHGGTVRNAVRLAKMLLYQGLECMSSDPVFSVLSESTISNPSVAVGRRRRSKEGIRATATSDPIPPKLKSKASSRAATQKQLLPPSDFKDLLCKALLELYSVHSLAQTSCASYMLHLISDLLGRSANMISATNSTLAKLTVDSIFTVCAAEMSRSIAMLKENSAIAVEKLLSDPDNTGLVIDPGDAKLDSLRPCTIDFSSFQADYIDIIPISWTVISISLSLSKNELQLSRLRCGQAPFILSIPLSRHNSRDADEDIFGFDQGKAELLEIIDLANYSSHDAQNMSRKGAKSEWWEARAALDAQLRDLLVNIENIWLGGFRGIFSQEKPQVSLLSRFQQSFINILDKHLPSRQKARNNSKSSRVILDSRVLELFVGLGAPSDENDLDESLMDLLYFVIDILQFHGERNAYDEIDFDSIAVQILDALTQYHEAAREDSQLPCPSHTILVLDKATHGFPWESLPCMAGQAISRVPSMSCLRSRILRQQQSYLDSEMQSNDGLHVDHTNGAYILNPGGDLVSTKKVFQRPLGSLTSWSAIIDDAPTEQEIATFLSERSLYLYFGHGSGGQYIRSRAIRKLDRCAVALLMGCSSVSLTEAGEYESHGTPINYLHAGAQAVVGTLWDVTDKDIDRFSMRALERWGLFEADFDGANDVSSPVKKGAKGKARATATKLRKPARERYESGTVSRGKVSLDQAVAEGRDACILKYLNGAAPVMYGVPVFLK